MSNVMPYVAPGGQLVRQLVRVAVKDNVAVRGMPLTCASRMLEHFIAPYTADCIQALVNAGGYGVVGKTNMDEFGMGSHTADSVHGPVFHPELGEGVSAGGSSGGSAAAVFGGLADIGVGSDTGGSVRLPAAFCGLLGFKPAYGAISRRGLVSYAPSLDCVGLMSRVAEMEVLWRAYRIMAGYCSGDMTYNEHPSECRTETAPTRLCLLRCEQHCEENVWRPVVEYAQHLSCNSRLPIMCLEWGRFEEALAAYCAIALVEAWSCLQRYPLIAEDHSNCIYSTNTHPCAGFGDSVTKRLRLAQTLIRLKHVDVYERARDVSRSISEELCAIARDSIIVLPTAPTLPTLLHRKGDGCDASVDLFTVPFSLAGLPTWSVPCQEKWVGVQLCHQSPRTVYSLLRQHCREGLG